jgi:hypothetical protein
MGKTKNVNADDAQVFIGDTGVTGPPNRWIHEGCRHVWAPHTIKEDHHERLVKVCIKCHKIEELVK